MIFADFADLDIYKGVSKNLDTAIDYIKGLKIKDLEVGKFQVDGDNVYAIVSAYNTRAVEEGKYETHEKYLDIQCLIRGKENVLIAHRSTLESTGYDEGSEKENYLDGPEEVCVKLSPNKALILFREDAHKACCMIDGQSKPIKKLLFKVKI